MIGFFGVDGIRLPETKYDADPFVGERSQCRMMFETGGAFHVVEGFGPAAPFAGVVGELVEGLPEELRSGDPFAHQD